MRRRHYLGGMDRQMAHSDRRGLFPVEALLPSMVVGNRTPLRFCVKSWWAGDVEVVAVKSSASLGSSLR
jgi:hypothetical protein